MTDANPVTKSGDLLKNFAEAEIRYFARNLMHKLKNIKETSLNDSDRKERVHALSKLIELRDKQSVELMEELTRK